MQNRPQGLLGMFDNFIWLSIRCFWWVMQIIEFVMTLINNTYDWLLIVLAFSDWKFTFIMKFQTSCQNDDGHCVWYSTCAKIGDKTKNCAYDGPAKALDASGIVALKQWCSHLLPDKYKDGQEVFTCCDNKQVK